MSDVKATSITGFYFNNIIVVKFVKISLVFMFILLRQNIFFSPDFYVDACGYHGNQ